MSEISLLPRDESVAAETCPEERNPLNRSIEQVEAIPGFLVDNYLDIFNKKQKNYTSEQRTIRLIARSADVGAAKSVWQKLQTFHDRGIHVFAVFTDLRSKNDSRNTVREYANVFGIENAKKSVRIAKFRNSHETIEQLQLGEQQIYTEENEFEVSVRLVPEVSDTCVDGRTFAAAKVSFEMIWAISDELTRNELNV